MAIRASIRWAVFRRDGFRCRYCGRDAADGAILEPDHVIPSSAGGSDGMENLVTACRECNAGKSNRPLGEIPTRKRPPRVPSVGPFLEPDVPVGAFCATPLKIAAVGAQFGQRSYSAAYRFVARLDSGIQLPPLRRSDYGWFTLVTRDAAMTHQKSLIQSLGRRLMPGSDPLPS